MRKCTRQVNSKIGVLDLHLITRTRAMSTQESSLKPPLCHHVQDRVAEFAIANMKQCLEAGGLLVAV